MNSGTENLRPQSFYAQTLHKKLPPEVFEPVPVRFVWMIGYVIVAAAGMLTIKFGDLPWYLNVLMGLILGVSYGALGFFAHELLHGSIVRNRKIQDFIGFFCFMPFFISPTFWRFWHNQLHHGKTQAIISDPDAFPTLKIFKHSKFMQAMFPFTPGSGHKRSYTYLFFWFSFHVFVAQTYLRFRNSLFDRLNHKKVSIEFGLQVLVWGLLLYALGPQNLIWTFVIPFLTQNYFVMSYIATNHNLSPLTKINDPLVNSLTVTNTPWLESLHLNFGYHVEHHIFPTVSGIHSKKIHQLLKSEFGDIFQVMPKSKAVGLLYKTTRIYKNSKTLINPESLETYPTLGIKPSVVAPARNATNAMNIVDSLNLKKTDHPTASI